MSKTGQHPDEKDGWICPACWEDYLAHKDAEDDPDTYVTKPCGPASCPIMSSSSLPANPFLAKIVDGKCECIAPQVCS